MHRLRHVIAAGLVGLLVSPSAAALEQQLPPPPPPAPVRVGGNIPPPQKIKDVKPVYPAAAQSARAQGVVILEATIAPTGKVQDTKVIRSIPLLDEAAIEAVRQWEFTPTLVNGVPMPVIMTVTVNFTLTPPAGATSTSMITLGVATGRNGVRYVFEITPDRADKLPRWDPRQAPEPPLSMLEARRAGEAWLKAKASEIRTLELSAIGLLRVFPRPPLGSCGASGCWYYRMTFDPIVGGRLLAGGGDDTAVVLLDGSIVEPRTEPPPAAEIAGARRREF